MRGDEAVSLGWCFWHRACFGCLVCGVGLPVPVTEGGNEVVGGEGQWGNWCHGG